MSETVQRTSDERFAWPRGRIAAQVEQLRTKWPQAWVSRERNGNGLRLAALPGFELPAGWNKTICTALWLARVVADDDRVHSRFDGFWVDLPDLRLADHFHPHYSRSANDIVIPGFRHWKQLTHLLVEGPDVGSQSRHALHPRHDPAQPTEARTMSPLSLKPKLQGGL